MKVEFASAIALTLVASVIASECSSVPSTNDSVQCALDSGFSLSNITQALVNDSSLSTAFCSSDACQNFLIYSNVNLNECTINGLRIYGDIFVPLSSVCVDLIVVDTGSKSGSDDATNTSANASDSGSTVTGSTSSSTSAKIAKTLIGFVAAVATAVLL